MAQRFPPDDPREWLNRAHSNLAQARNVAPGIYLEDLCFQAQQAAEKALKGLLIHLGVHFPEGPDLEKLLGLIANYGQEIPSEILPAARLSRHTTEDGFLIVGEPVTRKDYAEAVSTSQQVVSWVEQRIREKPRRG